MDRAEAVLDQMEIKKAKSLARGKVVNTRRVCITLSRSCLLLLTMLVRLIGRIPTATPRCSPLSNNRRTMTKTRLKMATRLWPKIPHPLPRLSQAQISSRYQMKPPDPPQTTLTRLPEHCQKPGRYQEQFGDSLHSFPRSKLVDHALDLGSCRTRGFRSKEFQGIEVLALLGLFARLHNHSAFHPHLDSLGGR